MRNRRDSGHPGKKSAPYSSYTVSKNDLLLPSLLSNLPHKTRKIIKAVLRDRQVHVDGRPVTQFDHDLKPGQRVDVQWSRNSEKTRADELGIVHMDSALIVVNKPAGLLTIATAKEKRRTAYSMLSSFVKAEAPTNKIFIIHRLDRETSGLLMFARNERVKEQIQKNWIATVSQRSYVGVVEGQVNPPTGTVTSWLRESSAFTVYSSQNKNHGKKAVTRYRTLSGNAHFTLLQINLETGKKHQIRVHMQDLGHPITGDRKYGSHLDPLRRMGLHAQILAFEHPLTGKVYHFDTGVPKTFLKLCRSQSRH